MDHFEATRAMLEDCADMVLRLTDPASGAASDVACVRFNMLASCDIIRFLCEDVPLEKDAAGRQLVPLPSVDEPAVRITVDLLHGVRPVSALDKDETMQALRGMDVLGSRVLLPLVHARLWHWLSDSPLADVLPFVPRLALEPTVQTALLRRLVVIKPLWDGFKRDVLDTLAVDYDLAKVLLAHLIRFYPASTVLAAVVERLEHPTVDKLLGLCGEHGSYYHPSEVREVMTGLETALTKHGLDSPVRGLACMTRNAMGTYRALPLTAAKVHGTVLMFEMPIVSALLEFDTESVKPIFVRAASWLRLNVDKESGTMDISFVLSRIDDDGQANRVQLRVTCWSENTPASEVGSEVWYSFANIEPSAWTSLSQSVSCFGNCMQQMTALQAPSRMRLDFFYDMRHSALDRPF